MLIFSAAFRSLFLKEDFCCFTSYFLTGAATFLGASFLGASFLGYTLGASTFLGADSAFFGAASLLEDYLIGRGASAAFLGAYFLAGDAIFDFLAVTGLVAAACLIG